MALLKNGCFFIIRSFFIIFGIIAICSLPQLFFGTFPSASRALAMPPTPTLQLNFSNDFDSISNVISSLFHPTSITYTISNAGTQSPRLLSFSIFTRIIYAYINYYDLCFHYRRTPFYYFYHTYILLS